MKKIIQFIPSLNDGGAETLVKDYATLMDKKSFKTVILTVYDVKTTANYRLLKAAGIKIVSIFPKWNMRYKVYNKLFKTSYIRYRLKRILKDEKPDVVHIHMWLLKYFYGLDSLLKNVRLFYTCHSLPERYFYGDLNDEYTAAKWMLNHTSLKFIALHNDMKKELNTMFGIKDTVVIRNGINFNRFINTIEEKSVKRQSIGIPLDSYLVGHVGSFSEPKNHKFLVDIFSYVVKKEEKAHLLLVGAGNLENEIKDRIKSYGLENRVTIISHRSDIPELMKAMDVFLFPSLFEGLAIVIIEAQVCGLPCIVSDVVPKEAYNSDLITELSLDLNPEIWANAVINPQCNIEEWGDINNYDMDKVIHDLENLYLGFQK